MRGHRRLHLKRWTGVSAGWYRAPKSCGSGSRRRQTVRKATTRRRESASVARPCGVETPSMQRNGRPLARENREAPSSPAGSGGPGGEAMSWKSSMHGGGSVQRRSTDERRTKARHRRRRLGGRPPTKENTPKLTVRTPTGKAAKRDGACARSSQAGWEVKFTACCTT